MRGCPALAGSREPGTAVTATLPLGQPGLLEASAQRHDADDDCAAAEAFRCDQCERGAGLQYVRSANAAARPDARRDGQRVGILTLPIA